VINGILLRLKSLKTFKLDAVIKIADKLKEIKKIESDAAKAKG
jgi:hypothetical protein